MTFYLLVFIFIKFVNVYKFLMQIIELRKRADQKKVIWENGKFWSQSCLGLWHLGSSAKSQTFLLVLVRMSLYIVHEQEVAVT